MKPRLGDDLQDGWLLLGGPGDASVSGSQTAQMSSGGGSLSAHQTLAAAAAAAVLSASPINGGGGGRGPSFPTQER